MDRNPPFLFCFGLGYSALALARRLRFSGWRVAGTCRSEASAAALEAAGFEVTPFDRQHKPTDPDGVLGQASHVLSSVPPDDDGDPVLGLWGAALARRSNLAWVGYLSTTGVYGDRNGGWVDETSALSPSGERGRRRVEAEQGWIRLHKEAGLPVHLFRLAGIYGPGRSALDTMRSGRAQRVLKPGQVFSRIHVADIATVLQASIARPDPGAAYNVCDDDPAAPDAVIAHAAALLGLAPPPEIPFDQAPLSDMARSFYADNKRVANDRIKRDLGVTLAYPDYRAGLAALLAAGD
jgi:nucleoside-diphosphate-sugar epimerase